MRESTTRARRWAVLASAVVLALAGCGGDDDVGNADASAGEDGADTAEAESTAESDDTGDAGDAATEPAADDAAESGGGGGGGGTLVLGGDTITLDSARCFLEEQDAAAGGGKILFVAQGFGVTAGGEQLTLDVSRYDEDSQFVGDDVIVDIGDPFADDAVSLTANADLGTVTVDGSTLSADGLTFVNSDDLTEQAGSFEITC